MINLSNNQIVVMFVVYILSVFGVIHAIARREANGINPKEAKTMVLYVLAVLPGVNTLVTAIYFVLMGADRLLVRIHGGVGA